MPTTGGAPSQAQGTTECRQRPQDDGHPTFEDVCSAQGVREVCSARGIEPSVRLAIQLARSAFGPLYDLRADPQELRNVAGTRAARGIDRRLGMRLSRLRRCSGARGIARPTDGRPLCE